MSIKRRCPGCDELLEGIETDWTLSDKRIGSHQVATIGTAYNAREDLVHAVKFQIAANLAVYELDYDFELNLGFLGTAWVQCPKIRNEVNFVCLPKFA